MKSLWCAMHYHTAILRERINPLWYRYCLLFFFLVAPGLQNSCSLFDPQPPAHEGLVTPSGMVAVAANGKSFQQGADDQYSKFDERPVFTSCLTHDFCIDSTEVTIAEYRRISGRLPAEYLTATTVDISQPICFISWFDAVLFCNRKSIINGHDTVYSYTSADTTVLGSCFRLSGLAVNLRAAGYRLPTEAEWEFAAHGGSAGRFPWGDTADDATAGSYSWFSGNSGNRLHPVAQLMSNGYGAYDMAGNAMEWVNDIKGVYPAGSSIDFVGAAASPGDYRPVKGGSYRQSIERLRIANRSDDYETVSSSAFSHIGFRCAFGPVPSGLYSIGDKPVDETSTVRVVAPYVRSFFGTDKAKFVFVNIIDGHHRLCSVDFSLSDPKVACYGDTVETYVPVISPDGAWIAYATRDDGAVNGSAVYVRSFSDVSAPAVKLPAEPAFSPRWWVDPSVSDTFIIYTNSAVVNSSPSWASTATFMQKISGGNVAGAPVQIESAGSFRDGRSGDGEYLACGYDRLHVKKHSTGEDRILFTGPGNGKSNGDTSQVCNVSISPAPAKLPSVMLLDFGSRDSSTVTGRPYGIHENIFIADYDNTVRRFYTAPSGFVWSNPEWSGNQYFAACGLQAGNGRCSAAGTLNLVSGRYTDLVAGGDIHFPFLWIAHGDSLATPGLALDSIGNYNEPPSDLTQAVLAWKLNLFWKKYSTTQLFFLGSSRILHGIASQDFTRYPALNMASAGEGLMTAGRLIDNYILKHARQTKLVVLEVMIDEMDCDLFNGAYLFGYVYSKGYMYDLLHGFWQDSLPADFVKYAVLDHGIIPQSPDSLGGFLPAEQTGGWGGENPPVRKKNSWTTDTITFRENMAMIADINRKLAKKNIHLLLVIMPQSPYYRKLEMYGKYGWSLDAATAAVDSLRALERMNTFLHLYDAHNFGVHDYTDDDANDCDHLSATGAHKISRRLDSLITGILNP